MKEEKQRTTEKRDISSKRVLGNPVLYAQFLRDNIEIPFLKDIRPEDIEDVSERYIPYLGTEFEADTVKRVYLPNRQDGGSRAEVQSAKNGHEFASEPLFLVSLTEHKSQVDYDVSMQLLKYMLCIWQDYGKEMGRKREGVSVRKSFRYPVIIPIVYYEGKAPWTAERRFRARISDGESFQRWIPDFTYEVVRLHDYSNEELLERGDEMSLIMLFNKIQDGADLSEFLRLPRERLNDVVRDTPESVLDIIVSVIEGLCGKIDATKEETRECVSRVRERRMGYLFENMEKMSIQEERRNTAQARAELERAKEEAREEVKRVKEEAQENTVRSIVTVCQNLKASREQAIQEIMEECTLNEEEAQKKVAEYWKI